VSQLDDEPLDALIVPVYKDGTAPAQLSAEMRKQAEWVARQSGPQRIFTATTHMLLIDNDADGDNGAGNGDGNDDSVTRLVVVAAGQRDEYDVERARQVVSAGMRVLWHSTARRVGVVLDTETLDADSAVQSAVEGAFFAMWRPEAYRTSQEDRKLPPLEEVLLVGPEDAGAAIARGEAVGEAVNWARRLSNEPANHMTPSLLADEARSLAEGVGMVCEVLDEEQCAELGMHSFLSVARGSDEPAKLIVLRYHGRKGEGYDLGLVGKGITFDSGGISIKPAEDMHLMKYDMSGAAAVIAAGAAICRLGVPINLIAAAPCTENLPGGHATKPGDVVTSMSGKTVEVVNTDAEGRLVLIDGVSYVQAEGASRVVDVATLTGAIRIALGVHYTGLFGRPDGFVDAVQRAGRLAGERLWRMPLSDEIRDEVKSEVADLRNSAGRLGGAIKGAAFIEAGVDAETEWVHLDIAGTAWFEEDRPFSPKGPQGAAVRTLVELATRIAARS
jgi:leucyl aminopeptidase